MSTKDFTPTQTTSTTKSESERREFLRLGFRNSIKFKSVQRDKINMRLGTTVDVSESGILFNTNVVPEIASVLWMALDLKTLEICKCIEQHVLTEDGGILGRVVRIEENRGAKNYRVGVSFLTSDSDSQEINDR